jgi:L-ribulose-5-phosphate 4-epimerase
MSFKQLQISVYEANQYIVDQGLVVLTWGNVSGVDREKGVMAIKPSGVGYETMKPEDMVVVSLDTGEKLEGELKPSSDTPTHLELYRAFPSIGGVVHTHSSYAVSWAQAGHHIPCLGTTHADHFYGRIPVTGQLTSEEIEDEYEKNTGKLIVRWFKDHNIDPDTMPAVLVPHHGPFTWGQSIDKAVQNAVVLEEVAKMALFTYSIDGLAADCPRTLLDKHFLRKHGPGAYYGQG